MQGNINVLQDPEAILEDFVVPEAQDFIALRSQKCIAFLVVGVLFCVLAAVEFDEQFLRHAGEVDDVRAYRLLAAKFVAVELFVAQVVPKESFGIGPAFSEDLGVLEGLLGVLTLYFPPPARLRADALVLPTPPQGGSDGPY